MHVRTFTAVLGAVAMSAALAGAQDKSSTTSPNTNTPAANTVTFTGCLNSGSNRETFYLTKAKQKGTKSTDKSLKIVPAEKVSLSRFVPQEVEVTGTIDPVEPPSDAKAEGAVRTLTVTKVKLRNESCG